MYCDDDDDDVVQNLGRRNHTCLKPPYLAPVAESLPGCSESHHLLNGCPVLFPQLGFVLAGQ